jgi:YjbE family integral membrane protein
VAVRASLTVAVLWLLEVPGLMGAGGVLLAWIAYRLLAGDDGGKDHEVAAATGFWGAMRTIGIADAVMGLDNVLAVAGAAHGSVLLVVAGLVISIPIVVWGSTLILNWIERFPALLYIGGGVLAWTAAKMLADEPLIQQLLAGRSGLNALLYILVISSVLGSAWLRNRRAAAQDNARKEAMQ